MRTFFTFIKEVLRLGAFIIFFLIDNHAQIKMERFLQTQLLTLKGRKFYFFNFFNLLRLLLTVLSLLRLLVLLFVCIDFDKSLRIWQGFLVLIIEFHLDPGCRSDNLIERRFFSCLFNLIDSLDRLPTQMAFIDTLSCFNSANNAETCMAAG